MTDWNFWLSVITTVVAIIALMQTKQQIKLSNKQYLFSNRVEHYLIVKGLIQLYENNKTHLTVKDDGSAFEINYIFAQMTNNTYLEKITDTIAHPLENPYRKDFLIRMEIMKDVSTKIKFIFSGKIASFLGNYVLRYQELLLEMYQYQILLDKMEESAQKFNFTLDKAQEMFGEKQQREKLQKAIEDLRKAYDVLKKEDVEEKIERQIKIY